MLKRNITLLKPERFAAPHPIAPEKIDRAIEKALEKIEKNIKAWGDGFVGTYTTGYKYPIGENNNWVCGMHTGLYLLAWELSGKQIFLDAAKAHLETYKKRLDEKIALWDHDVGFVYTPACVAAYRVTGEKKYREWALEAANHLYDAGFAKKGGFILRGFNWPGEGGCRTMMDTLMNAPLLFWSAEQTGNKEHYDAAMSQEKITERLLIREDASSFHHYQFEPDTFAPRCGVTWQGHSDDSCWSRGHSWGVYGFPIAYDYCKEDWLIGLHKDIVYFMLNHLPDDMVPYWDYDFMEGDHPRDTSASTVAVCGLMEMCRHLPDDAEQKAVFESAAGQLLDAVIDGYTGDIGTEYEGLIHHVTAGVPQNIGIDECAIYGDYFYLEALMRCKNPDWVRYW